MASNRNNRGIAAYIAVAAVLILAFVFIFPQITESGKKTQYSDVIKYFDDYKVSSYTLDLGSGELEFTIEGEEKPRQYTVPNVSVFLDDTENYRENYNQKHPDAPLKQDYKKIKDNSWILSVVPTVLMLGLGIALFIFMMKQAGGGGKYSSFGKANIKNQAHNNGKKVTFADVAGADEEKHEMEEIVDFLKNPKKYSEIGARIPKGVLLLGPPGTGKTLLAKAVAGEAGCPFFPISGSDFVEMFVGVGASRVRDLFEQAKKNAPSIIFIDEIDAVGRQRGTGLGGGHDEREQTLNQLLVEMDGFTGNESVIVIAATNRRDILDPALLRPGRFDRQIVVSYPDIKGREEVLKVHTRNKPLAPDVNLKTIAQTTVGFTGADLENLVNEASLLAARADRKAITKEDIEEATIKVVAGPEKKSRVVTEREKKLTSYHEAGHAICTYYCPSQDKVHQVSIIPRGMAGGFTMSLPEHDKSYMSKTEMYENIVTLLGGRVAEKLILDDISTGASNDLERATSIARNMVTRYGFSEKLGPMVYGNDQSEVFLGRDFNSNRNYSENVAAEIDAEMREIIEGGYQKSKDILEEHMDQLHLLAKYLMKFEKIDSNDFEILMKGEMDPKVFENSPEDTKTEENSEPESTNVTNENSTKTEE
ncbi:MAG: ATP-dependent zinc metalloprotease FtsH [Oscillospiraceae bacterium]|uniref:ATP-dependent zinc metalloprotease FtsH n=1 Tax=Porcipelethomonas ammoniilytica TaxID=2981722 RepID=UPI0008231A0C|nr:MAG: cell division protein FtsH [Ruminococcus sp. 37_24]SCI61487.1 ATP-dependent zinc metalloprotease FtsH [uncultured Ruminococcus sp.]